MPVVALSCAHGDDQMVRLALRAVMLAMRTDANRR